MKSEKETSSGETPKEEGGEGDPVPAPEGEEPVVPVEEPSAADPASVPPAEEGAPVVPPEVPVAPEGEPVSPVPVTPGPEVPPVVSLEEFNQVKSELEEQKKANEGLAARISSLEEALKSAGVIEGGASTEVGRETPVVPNPSAVDTTMDDVLREINHKGY